MNAMLQPYGYRAMVAFLQKRNEREESDTLTRLLGELAQDEKGRISEDIRDEWTSAVNDAMSGGVESITQLHLS